jgi:hypothetical protein
MKNCHPPASSALEYTLKKKDEKKVDKRSPLNSSGA